MVTRVIPKQPPEVFIRKTNHVAGVTYPAFVLDEQRKPAPIEFVEGKGIFVYREGALHPEKGWPYAEQIYAMDIIKRILVELTGMLSNPLLLLGFIFADKNILMRRFNSVFDKAYELPNMYEERFLCDASRYSIKFLSSCLIDCGYNETISRAFSYRISLIVEGDSRYRYVIQDLAGEFDKDAKPRKEIKRLLRIYTEREDAKDLALKIKRMFNLITLLLLIPKYRRAFIKNSYLIPFMRLDDADFYWADIAAVGNYGIKPKANYNYRGKSFEERMNKPKPKRVIPSTGEIMKDNGEIIKDTYE